MTQRDIDSRNGNEMNGMEWNGMEWNGIKSLLHTTTEEHYEHFD